MEVTQTQIDDLMTAVDFYSTKCAQKQKHCESWLKPVVQQYAKIIGVTQDCARTHIMKNVLL